MLVPDKWFVPSKKDLVKMGYSRQFRSDLHDEITDYIDSWFIQANQAWQNRPEYSKYFGEVDRIGERNGTLRQYITDVESELASASMSVRKATKRTKRLAKKVDKSRKKDRARKQCWSEPQIGLTSLPDVSIPANLDYAHVADTFASALTVYFNSQNLWSQNRVVWCAHMLAISNLFTKALLGPEKATELRHAIMGRFEDLVVASEKFSREYIEKSLVRPQSMSFRDRVSHILGSNITPFLLTALPFMWSCDFEFGDFIKLLSRYDDRRAKSKTDLVSILVDWVYWLFQTGYRFVANGFDTSVFTLTADDYFVWLEDVAKLKSDVNCVGFDQTVEVNEFLRRANQLESRGKLLYEAAVRARSVVSGALRNEYKWVRELIDSERMLELVRQDRIEPFLVMYKSVPGAGKSHQVTDTLHVYDEACGVPYDRKTRHDMSAVDKFASNFRSDQNKLVWDDTGLVRAGFAPELITSFVEALIRARGLNPAATNQAAVEDKGKIFIRADLIVVTTNHDHCGVTDEVMECREAFFRRIDVRIDPVVKPEFRPEPGLNMFSDEAFVDNPTWDTHNYMVYRFDSMKHRDKMNKKNELSWVLIDGLPEDGFNKQELMRYLYLRFKEHNRRGKEKSQARRRADESTWCDEHSLLSYQCGCDEGDGSQFKEGEGIRVTFDSKGRVVEPQGPVSSAFERCKRKVKEKLESADDIRKFTKASLSIAFSLIEAHKSFMAYSDWMKSIFHNSLDVFYKFILNWRDYVFSATLAAGAVASWNHSMARSLPVTTPQGVTSSLLKKISKGVDVHESWIQEPGNVVSMCDVGRSTTLDVAYYKIVASLVLVKGEKDSKVPATYGYVLDSQRVLCVAHIDQPFSVSKNGKSVRITRTKKIKNKDLMILYCDATLLVSKKSHILSLFSDSVSLRAKSTMSATLLRTPSDLSTDRLFRTDDVDVIIDNFFLDYSDGDVSNSKFRFITDRNGSFMCGSLLVATVGNKFAIVGVHVAGSNDPQRGYHEIGVVEPIDSIDLSEPIIMTGHPHFQNAPGDLGSRSLSQKKTVKFDPGFIHPLAFLHSEPVGPHHKVLGTIWNFRQTNASKYKKSPFYGSLPYLNDAFCTPFLKPTRHDGNWIDQYATNFRPMQDPTLPSIVHEEIPNLYLKELMETLSEHEHCFEPLTVHEVLNGIDGVPYIDRKDLKTSIGFPEHGSKRKFVKENEDGTLYATAEFKSNLQSVADQLACGKVTDIIVTAHLKDEVLKPKKKFAGRERVFNGIPFELNVIVCQAFGILQKLLQEKWRQTGNMVGINATSGQWQEFANVLKLFFFLFDGDFKFYDKKFCQTVIRIVYGILSSLSVFIHRKKSKLYGHPLEMILKGIISCLSQYMLLTNGTLVECTTGNISGISITVLVNNIANQLYMKSSFRRIMGRYPRPVDLFTATYGDDNINATNCQAFSQRAVIEDMAKHNMTYTPADKESEAVDFVPFEDISFIGRTFSDRNGQYVAPIRRSAVTKNLSFIRVTEELEHDVMTSKIRSALIEISYFPEEEKEVWRAWMEENVPQHYPNISLSDFEWDYCGNVDLRNRTVE
jgi:hypothetical protein